MIYGDTCSYCRHFITVKDNILQDIFSDQIMIVASGLMIGHAKVHERKGPLRVSKRVSKIAALFGTATKRLHQTTLNDTQKQNFDSSGLERRDVPGYSVRNDC